MPLELGYQRPIVKNQTRLQLSPLSLHVREERMFLLKSSTQRGRELSSKQVNFCQVIYIAVAYSGHSSHLFKNHS